MLIGLFSLFDLSLSYFEPLLKLPKLLPPNRKDSELKEPEGVPPTLSAYSSSFSFSVILECLTLLKIPPKNE